MVARSAPGFLLGFFVVAGTVAASLAVRPRAGRMIFPVPVLSYLVAALISGVVFDRSAGASKTVLAIGAAQWIASGFSAMVLATVLAVVITTVRWFLWRRGRPATRGQAGPGRDGAARPPRGAWETSAESGYPAGFAGPGSPRESGEAGLGLLGVLGSGATRAHAAPAPVPALVPGRVTEPNLTTSPAGRNGALGA